MDYSSCGLCRVVHPLASYMVGMIQNLGRRLCLRTSTLQQLQTSTFIARRKNYFCRTISFIGSFLMNNLPYSAHGNCVFSPLCKFLFFAHHIEVPRDTFRQFQSRCWSNMTGIAVRILWYERLLRRMSIIWVRNIDWRLIYCAYKKLACSIRMSSMGYSLVNCWWQIANKCKYISVVLI